jgi:hypothetical protein
MTKTKRRSPRKGKKWRCGWPAGEPNDGHAEQAVNAMYPLIEALLAEHGRGCECVHCYHSAPLLWSVDNALAGMRYELV